MDDFKIALFEQEYSVGFPQFKELTKPECDQLFAEIIKKYSINASAFAVELVSLQSLYTGVNAENDFALRATLISLDIKPLTEVFINWYKFEKIDSLSVDDLDKCFDSIWFPSSDDIDIFDKSLSWILSIRHDGCVSFMK